MLAGILGIYSPEGDKTSMEYIPGGFPHNSIANCLSFSLTLSSTVLLPMVGSITP